MKNGAVDRRRRLIVGRGRKTWLRLLCKPATLKALFSLVRLIAELMRNPVS
jgi:hypothetical protein